MESNNVIVFPKENPRHPKSIEKIKSQVEVMKYYHIQEVISTLIPMIFNQLEIAGFVTDTDSEENMKDGVFVVESIKSFMCKHYGIYHPFQQISTNVFTPDEEDVNSLHITDKLNLELKQTETN